MSSTPPLVRQESRLALPGTLRQESDWYRTQSGSTSFSDSSEATIMFR